MRILSNSAKFSAGPYFQRIILPPQWPLPTALIVWAVENMPPHVSAHVYYGKTAGWIKMPLSTEVGLGPGDIVLDGDSAPLHAKGHSSPPLFSPLLWPASPQARILPITCIVD